MNRALSVALSAALLGGCLNITVADSDGRIAEPGSGAVAGSRATAVDDSPIPGHQRASAWYTDAAERVASTRDRYRDPGTARNIILFLGDGMGMSTITAGRIYAGQRAGGSGEEHRLSFEEFPFTGLAKTYNVNAQTPDSAGTMSAIVTGVKTDIGVFGVDEEVVRDDCASSQGRELLSLLSLAELAGKRTGVVSTARLTHATPAATYASTANRDWEDDSEMPEEARQLGCTDIASQFVDHRKALNARFGADASDGIEVALGGGRRHFLPADAGGSRSDGENLVARWQRAYPSGTYAETAAALAAAIEAPVLGLFADSHMDYAMQREAAGNTQPSLVAMTEKAIDLLEDGNGYFLMVEGGRIDHAHHAGNAANALNETAEMADAVAAAMAKVDPEETLIIVTADHSHVFTMAGYPRRGNPILGKVVPAWSDEPMLDVDGIPYTTLGYMNGRGYRDYGGETNADRTYAEPPAAGRRDISDVDTTTPGYHQEALVPINSETHGGEDVPVYATGPGATAATGSYEQNLLYHVMLQASDWERAAAQRLAGLKD
jgi:alkaline phosphatase